MGKFADVLYGLYRADPADFLRKDQYIEFLHENRKILKGSP